MTLSVLIRIVDEPKPRSNLLFAYNIKVFGDFSPYNLNYFPTLKAKIYKLRILNL